MVARTINPEFPNQAMLREVGSVLGTTQRGLDEPF